MITLLRDLLRTPSAQSGDPGGWAATLLAHAWIGVAMGALLPAWLALALYAAWEAVQWALYGADIWDCLLDWTAVALGVVTAVSLRGDMGSIDTVITVGAMLVIAAVGVRKRSAKER